MITSKEIVAAIRAMSDEERRDISAALHDGVRRSPMPETSDFTQQWREQRDRARRDFLIGFDLAYTQGHKQMSPDQRENADIEAGWYWGYNISRGRGMVDYDLEFEGSEIGKHLAEAHALAAVHDYYMLRYAYGRLEPAGARPQRKRVSIMIDGLDSEIPF